MDQAFKTILTFGVLVFLITGLYFFSDWFSKTTGYVLGEDEKIKLAQCLSTKDSVFYRSSTCPECDRQLELFGEEASRLLQISNCASVDDCPPGGVPAWEIGSETYYGFKKFEELISISKCSIS